MAAKAANRSGCARTVSASRSLAMRASAHRGLGVHLLQPGIGVRQHLHVDAGLVHLLDAEAGEVVQALGDGGKLPASSGA